MTAAATDGSTADSASVTLAVFVRPDSRKPAIAGEERRERRTATISTCHDRAPDRRAAIGLSPTAYSSRPYPVRRSANEDERGDRDEDDAGCWAMTPHARSRTRWSAGSRRHAGAGLDRLQLPDVGEAEHDEAHAQGHDQRVDPEDADADAGDQAGQRGDAASATTIADGQPPGLLISVAVTNPAIEATAPTDRSMPPVSIVSVWQPARIASGTAGAQDDTGPVRA